MWGQLGITVMELPMKWGKFAEFQGGQDVVSSKYVLIISLIISEPFTPLILILTHQQQTAFESIVEKEEIARNEQFLLFPQCFLLNQKIVLAFVNIFDIISLFAADLEEPKIGI